MGEKRDVNGVNSIIANRIYELANKGLPKERIVQQVKKLSQNLGRNIGEEGINVAVEHAMNAIKNNAFHAGVRAFLGATERANSDAYVGKDGRGYDTRADLEIANGVYRDGNINRF